MHEINTADRPDAGRLADAIAWIESRPAETTRMLRRWCDQNSWSLDAAQLGAMSEMLVDDFGQLGIDLQRRSVGPLKLLGDTESWVEQETGPLLCFDHNPDANDRLLLMIHYDTVYPPGSQPSRCEIDGTRMTGPGTADAKGGIAVIASAVAAALRFDLAGNIGVSILLNPDEEVGTTASGPTIESMVRAGVAGKSAWKQALVFEPTLPDGSLVASRKGSGNFAWIVRGRSAHAGRNPQDGRNAIACAAGLVARLVALNDPAGGTLVNVGRIQGGGPLNRVPDHAVVACNVRVANERATESIRLAMDSIADELTVDGFRVSLVGEFHSPPKVVDVAQSPVHQCVTAAATRAGRTIGWQDTGGACDGSKLWAWGLPNVDTMGVTGGHLHSPHEFCELDSLESAATTVATFIADFQAGASGTHA